MRFELANEFGEDSVLWKVRFFYGSSKDIRTIELNGQYKKLVQKVRSASPNGNPLAKPLKSFGQFLRNIEPGDLQQVWNHSQSGVSPYDLTDKIGDIARTVASKIKTCKSDVQMELIADVLNIDLVGGNQKIINKHKFEKYRAEILSGIIVGSYLNSHSA